MRWLDRFAREIETETASLREKTNHYSSEHRKWMRRFDQVEYISKIGVAVMLVGLAIWVWKIFDVGAFNSLPYLLIFYGGYALLMIGYFAMWYCRDRGAAVMAAWDRDDQSIWQLLAGAFSRSLDQR